MKKYIYILLMLAAPWHLSAQTLTIGDGAIVTIGVGASVSYGTAASSGTVTSDANTKLVIESTSSGSGSLICGGTPNATVQRYVTSSRWNMVTPTTTGTTGQTFFDASGNDSWLTYYDETVGTNGGSAGEGWVYIYDLTDAVNVGQGYTYYPSANETVEFKGNLQSANLSPTITYTGSTKGFNLIGNPFPSALYWDGTWTMSSVENSIWIWNGTQYQSSPGGLTTHYIPVGQGFFVRADNNSPSITIPASKKAHNTQAFLKKMERESNSEFIYLKIDAQNNLYQDEVFIYFNENGTNGFDNGFDATKMFGSGEAPQLYLVENEYKQSYDYLPLLAEDEERSVNMSYIPGADGSQILVADFTYFQNIIVTLEDLQTSTMQVLNENPVYSFNGSKDDEAERFLLHFAYTPNGIGDEESTASNINIYSYNNQIYISSINELNGSVAVYDIMGRELYEQKLHNTQKEQFSINVSNTYVIVQLNTGSTIKTQKVYIK